MQWKSGYFAGQCSFVYYCTPVKFLNKEENTIHESDFILTGYLFFKTLNVKYVEQLQIQESCMRSWVEFSDIEM